MEIAFDPPMGRNHMGWAMMAAGQVQKAAAYFKKVLCLIKRPIVNPIHVQLQFFIFALAGLGEALDDQEEFRAFCSRFIEKYPQARGTTFRKWYLEPAGLSIFAGNVITESFNKELSDHWTWVDPLDTRTFKVGNGLEICGRSTPPPPG